MNAPTSYDDPVIRPLDAFAGVRRLPTPADRLAAIRRQARAFREQLLDGPPVPMMRSFDLVKVPYPTRYGLRDACSVPIPYIHILNRLFVVQFDTPQGIKTLLAEPLDREGNAQTPFFHRLARKVGGAEGRLSRAMWPELGTVAGCLAQLGLTPDDVDYITYDHLHTQDLRRWLGTDTREAFFPRAKLLVMRQEWMSTQGLLPLQAEWYCPHGTEGVPPERVVLLDGDVMLGQSVALVHTPGHTEGNHSLVVHTPEGIFVSSENGVSADSYAPDKSDIPGLRRYAAVTGAEVDDATALALRWDSAQPEYVSEFVLMGAPGSGSMVDPPFVISAGATGHVEAVEWPVPPIGLADVRIWSVLNHMHKVGVDMKTSLIRNTGSEDCLVQTPDWDFDWQRFYEYDAPIEQAPRVFSGDTVRVRCTYDNTLDNPGVVEALGQQGLEAPVEVRLGEETLDEMCLGVYGIAYPNIF
ncbi:MAG: hypothetical protein KDK70_06890 [Myxococcales bacterium]|nr:hypothetical protein [Myxococcales bacterium]